MLFLILTVILFNLFALFMPKRMSMIEIITTCLFALHLQTIFDVYLDLKYGWYGYFQKGADWGTLIFVYGIYPAINLIYLNYFPGGKSWMRKTLYIAAWSIFALIYEVLFLWSGTFYYNGWKLWYSAICYPFLLIALYLFHQYVLHLLKRYRR